MYVYYICRILQVLIITQFVWSHEKNIDVQSMHIYIICCNMLHQFHWIPNCVARLTFNGKDPIYPTDGQQETLHTI
jgi:hypothetical protein